MEKIAEHVSGFEKSANEEDRLREDVNLGGSPWGSWKDAGKEPEHAKARATGMDKVKRETCATWRHTAATENTRRTAPS